MIISVSFPSTSLVPRLLPCPAYKQAFSLLKKWPGYLARHWLLPRHWREKSRRRRWPVQDIIASDIHKDFWEYDHQLFKSTHQTFPVSLILGDAFDPSFISSRVHSGRKRNCNASLKHPILPYAYPRLNICHKRVIPSSICSLRADSYNWRNLSPLSTFSHRERICNNWSACRNACQRNQK